uniref:T cell leukemia/lymphoma 1B n=1 Tax=Ursus maritimus TaxID=29073 RepID=A0A452T5P2_URSMA
MASGASLCLGVPPHRLWAVRPGIYEDEKGRTWVTVVVRLSPSQRARDGAALPLGPPMSPSQLPLSQLPLVWQLYPGRRYRAMDSRLWKSHQISHHLILARILSGACINVPLYRRES